METRLAHLRRKRISSESAFTLIELLVVLLILTIILAIALPNFLGQEDKAHDTKAKMSLMNSARSLQAINASGALPPEAELIAELQYDQGTYTYHAYNNGATPSIGPDDISVVRENDNQASICSLSNTGTSFCVRVNAQGQITIVADIDETGGLGDIVASINPLFPESASAAATEISSNKRMSFCSGDTEAEARTCLRNSPDGVGGVEECPEGQVGTPPDCETPPPPTCPEGQLGTPPDCYTPLTYEQEVAQDSPGAQCNFDESGNAYVNLVCTNVNGQYQDNSTKFVTRQDGAIETAPAGKSVFFTGETHYTYGNPSNASLNNQGQNWSSEIWVKPAQSATNQIIASADDNWGLAFDGSNGFRCAMRLGNPWSVVSISGGQASQAGNWYHVVCTYQAGTLRLYVNGQQVASQGGFPIGQSGNGNFRPGYAGNWWMNGSYLRGNLDQFSFYKSTLSPQRILAHYNAAKL